MSDDSFWPWTKDQKYWPDAGDCSSPPPEIPRMPE